jgi:hypothetical protein
MNVNELEPLSELVDAVEAYHKAIYRTAIDPHTLSAARAALEALTRAGQEPVAVKVKPLEWEGDYTTHAKTSFAPQYRISFRADGMFEAYNLDGGFIGSPHSTYEAAKAAAQADYEKRILSALEAAPDRAGQEPVADGVGVDLTPVIKWLRGGCDPLAAADELELYRARLAAQPVAAQEGVKVKPLEWDETASGWEAEAGMFCRSYLIEKQYDGYRMDYNWTEQLRQIDTLDAAKAAAQADYEKRILSALEAPPDASAIRRQALEDGLRHAAGELLTHIDKYHDYEGDTPASANLRYIYHHLLGCLTYGEGNSLAIAGGQNDK